MTFPFLMTAEYEVALPNYEDFDYDYISLGCYYDVDVDEGDYWTPGSVDIDMGELFIFESFAWEGNLIEEGTLYSALPESLKKALPEYKKMEWEMRDTIISNHDC